MATIGKFVYELTQSVSSSFNENDTVEFTFQAVGTSNISRNSQQSVDLYYSLASGSPSWVQASNYPKVFGIGTSYATKSFSTTVNGDWQAVKAIITGSVFTASDDNGAFNASALNIDYDALQITTYSPKSELTDKGLLVFRSPSKFIKADENGIEIKGGTFQTEKLIAEELEVFGDVTIFGDFQASPIPPYAGGMIDIASGSGANGTSADYARGDHTHEMTFEVVDSLLSNKVFSNNISTSATGSFAKVNISDGGTSAFTGFDLNGRITMRSDGVFKWGNVADYGTLTWDTGKVMIGGLSGKSLQLNADATARMFISSSGNVGIGTLTPVAKEGLTIKQNATIGSNSNASVARTSASLLIEESSTHYLAMDANEITNYGGDLYLGVLGNSTNDGNIYIRAGVSGLANRMFISSSGKIGIGTTSPIADLDIRDGHIKVGEYNIYSSNVDQPYLIVADDDHYTGETTNWGTYGMQHRIKVDSGGVPRLTIDSLHGELFSVVHGGNVGIGTATPTEELVVHGNISASGNILADGDIQLKNTKALKIENAAGTSTQVVKVDSGDDIYVGHSNFDNIYLQGSGGTIMSLQGTGNVGIGTTSPGHLLDIRGNMRISSSLATLYLEGNGSSHTHGRVVIDTDNNGRGGGVYWRDTTNVRQFFSGVAYAGSGIRWQVGYHSGSEGSSPEDASNLASSILTVLADTNENGVGKVGIGTTTPLVKLDVETSDNQMLRLKSTSNKAYLSMGDDDSTGYFGAENGYLSLGAQAGVHSHNINYHLANNTVSIGNATSTSKLSVTGDIKASTNITASGNISSSGTIISTGNITTDSDLSASGDLYVNNTIFFGDGVNDYSSDATISSSAETLQISDNANVDIIIDKNGTTTKGTFAVKAHTGQNTKFMVSSSGNVGIGTTDPRELLHIASDSDPTLVIQNTGANQANSGKISFREALATTERVNIRYDGADNKLIIDTEEVSNAFVVDRATGNIGIGTTIPGDTLPTLFAATTPKVVEIKSTTTSTDAGLLLRRSDNATGIDIWNDGSGGNSFIDNRYNTDSSNLHFRVKTNGTPVTAMSVGGDGFVGIGTTTPVHALHLSSSSEVLVDIESSADDERAGIRFNTKRVGTGMGSSYLYKTGSLTEFSLDEGLNFKSNGKTWMYGSHTEIQFYSSSAADANKTVFFHADIADRMIGIGTSSPSYTLEVSSGTTNEIARFASTDDDGLISVGDDNDMTYIGYNHSNTAMSLGFDNGLGATNLNILTDGKVGIGLTDPDEKLEVAGNIRIANSGKVYLWADHDSNYIDYGKWATSRVAGKEITNATGKITLTSHAVSNGLVLSGSDVGVGVSAPKSNLHITGGGDGQAFGGKNITITESPVVVLTIGLGNHESAYVKMTMNGSWPNHSGMMFMGEYFISNGGTGGYNEPGQIIREVDNTGGPSTGYQNTDTIQTKLVENGDTVEIQAWINDADAGVNDESADVNLNFHIMGEFDTIT